MATSFFFSIFHTQLFRLRSVDRHILGFGRAETEQYWGGARYMLPPVGAQHPELEEINGMTIN